MAALPDDTCLAVVVTITRVYNFVGNKRFRIAKRWTWCLILFENEDAGFKNCDTK